ncbi:platelet endothelial aggregation receptor 1-like [Saccostrea echinata]|uniref:platelet endothelial aggregation receptor 1-like n=1 Tax=Saccostrea echinata TaxID=191078 RepID=UPI002A817D94|nr:platelet endothelial aggregation receptor 1-like [Saccostrea echinata]
MTLTNGVCSREGEPFKCCPNNYQINMTCVQCPPGRFGINCSDDCPPIHYGKNCAYLCNCSDSYECDAVTGCKLVTTGTGYGLESDPVPNDDGVKPGVLAAVVIVLIVCVTSIIVISVFLIKRRNTFSIKNTDARRHLAKPYVIKDLNTLSDSFNEKDNALYSEVIRDINQKKQQYNHNPASSGNIYCSHVIPDSTYDKLQFHPKTETILRDNELYGANI